MNIVYENHINPNPHISFILMDWGCRESFHTIEYLNNKHDLKLSCFLKGFPHPSGANARKNIQFNEHKLAMMNLLKSNN